MAKHRRLKPIREYLYDKGEMIEQMFSSIPIVEVRNMVPIKLQGMPLHELKAECLVELLEMSDREIMNIVEGKKTRDPSSSESEAGAVVVISDDEQRIKKEKKSIRRPAARREDSDGSSTEQSISSKKKNKRKSKEEDDPKGKKKKKVVSRQPVPSSSKDVQPGKEITKKKNRSKPAEKPKLQPGEVVVLDDLSSEESWNEASKNTGEKSLLDLLELEMRARAIRSLLKQEEETQAKKILSEYKDEPDDLIPVEVPPPQVDLLSDSDEDLKDDGAAVQPSTDGGLRMEVEGDVSSKGVSISNPLLGMENRGASEVVEIMIVDEASADSVKVNFTCNDSTAGKDDSSMSSSSVNNSINEPGKCKSDPTPPKVIDSKQMKYGESDCEITIKVEKESSGESNEQRKIERPVVKAPPSSAEPSSLTITKFSKNSSNVRITPESSACALKEIAEVNNSSSKESATLMKIDQTDISVPDVCSGDHISSVIKIEPEPDGIPIGASKFNSQETEENISSPPKKLPVDCSKPLSVSTGDEYHSNFDEDILDYDYDPSLNNSERQSLDSEGTGTTCPQSSLLSGALTIKSEKVEDDCIKEQSEIDEQLDTGQASEMIEKQFSSSDKFRESKSSLIENNLNPSDGREALMDEQLRRQADGTVIETETVIRHMEEQSLKARNSISIDERDSSNMIPFGNEEVLLDISEDEDVCIQPAERGISNQEKGRVTLLEKEQIPSDHCTSDNIANSIEKPHNHFLVNSALGSLEATSPESTIKSQEHSETDSYMDMYQDKTKDGVDAIDSQDHHDMHSRNEEQRMASDHELLGLPDVQSRKLPIGRQTLHDASVGDIADCSLDQSKATPVPENEQNSANQRTDNGIAASSEVHNSFLVNEAVAFPEAVSLRSTVESQERNEADSPMGGYKNLNRGSDRVVQEKAQSKEEQGTLSSAEPLDYSDVQSSKISAKRRELLDTSVGGAHNSLDKNGTDLVAEIELSSPDELVGDKIVGLSDEPHNQHFLVSDALGSSRILSSRSSMKSQEHIETNSSVNIVGFPIHGEDATLVSHYHNDMLLNKEEGTPSGHESLDSADVGSPKIVIDRLELPDSPMQEPTKCFSDVTGVAPLEQEQLDFLVSNDLDFSGNQNHLSPKPKVVVDEHNDPFHKAQEDNGVLTKKVQTECDSAEGLANNGHFLVNVALDSLDAEVSETEAVSQEQNDQSSRDVGDDCLLPGSKVTKHNKDAYPEATIRVDRETKTSGRSYEIDETSVLVNNDLSLLKSETSITNLKLPYSKVENEMVLSKETVDTISAPRIDEITPKDMGKRDFSALEAPGPTSAVPLSATPVNEEKGELSVNERESNPSLDNEANAFVGCNSIETQKKIQITDGHAARQPFTLDVSSHAALSGKRSTKEQVCDTYSMEYVAVSSENEFDEVSGRNEYLGESVDCCLENNSVENRFSSAWNATQLSSEFLKGTSQPKDSRPASAPFPQTKGSGLEISQSSLFEEVRTYASGSGKNNSEGIETDYEGLGGLRSEEKQNSEVLECLKKTTSRLGDHCPMSSESPPTKPMNLEHIQSYMTEGIRTDSSGAGNNSCEVIEIHGEVLSGSSSEKQQISNVAKCLEEIISSLEDPCPSSIPSPPTKASAVETAHSNVKVDDIETGNSYSSKIIEINDEGSIFNSSMVKQTSQRNECLTEKPSHQRDICPLFVPFPPTKGSILEPTHSPLIQKVRTNLSCSENNSSEVIEICDEDSSASSGEEERISRGPKSSKKVASSLDDPCLSHLPSFPTRSSSLETLHLSEVRAGRSKIIKIDEEARINSVENQTVQETECFKERTSSLEDPFISSISSPPTKESSLDPTQPSLFQEVRTCDLGTGTNNSEIIEIIDDEDSDCSCHEKEQIPTVIKSSKEITVSLENYCLLSLPSPPTKVSNLETSLVEEVETGESATKVNSTKVHEDRLSFSRSVDKQNFQGTECKKETSHHEDPFLISASSSPTKTSSLEPIQSFLNQIVRTGDLGKENNNSEVIEIDDEDFGGSSSEEEQLSKVAEYLKKITSGLEDPCPSSVPSPQTKSSCLEPASSSLIGGARTENNISEIIEIDDEDSDATDGEVTSKETDCLEVTSSEIGVPFFLPAPSSTSKASSLEPIAKFSSIENRVDKLVKGSNHFEVIEIDDEDSGDSSSDSEEGCGDSSEDSTENDEESSLTVHSISDDEASVGTQLNKGVLESFDGEEVHLECITDDEMAENNGLQIGERLFITTALETKSDDIIDISDSGGEGSPSADSSIKYLVPCCGKEVESTTCDKNDPEITVTRSSDGAQNIDGKVIDVTHSNANSGIQISSRNKGSIILQGVNIHESVSSWDGENNSVDQPGKEPIPLVNKELEEGEIEEGDSVVQRSKNEGIQYSKAWGRLGTSSVTRIRSLKQNRVTDIESDSSTDSFCRKRSRKRVKLREKRRRMMSESHEIRSTEKKSGKVKDQEKHLPMESSIVPFISAEVRNPEQTLNVLKQVSTRKADVNTVVPQDDDDEKIVQAITEQMPPEILELDDSDETKTNWTARWLESSHVKKVVTTSKILTNARKKLKLKLKVKGVPVIEAAPPLTEVPRLIGSVEEYHRLVKEGVITSSKPDATKKSVADTGLKKGAAAENSEATPNIEIAPDVLMEKVDDDCLDRAKSSDEVHVKSLENERFYNPVVAIDQHGAKSVAPSDVGARDDDLVVKDSMLLSDSNNSIAAGVPQKAEMDDGKYKYGLASNSACGSPVSKTNILENERDKSSKPVDTDPLSGSIKSFYEMMKPNQVIGIASSLKSLSDIPFPSSVLGRVETKCASSVSLPPALSPSATSPVTTATESNDVHVSNQMISISPSPNICYTTEKNPIGILESVQVDAPQLFSGENLEEGEIEDSDCGLDNSVCTTAVENHNTVSVSMNNVANTYSPTVQLPSPIQTATRVHNVQVEMPSVKISAQPVISSSYSVQCTSTRVNPIVPGSDADLHNQSTRQCVQSTVAGNSVVHSLPFLPNSTSQIVGHATAITQCDNTAVSSSAVHATHGVSTISHSTLSSVVSPSYSISEGQATPFMVNSALQSSTVSGVQAAFPPINPIKAATAEISNLYQYGTPPSVLVRPQMSLNVNSTLNIYDQYYNWMYRQGLSASTNSSYGYGAPDPSQDASIIYRQWGEYYKKLMEACEDSAARASLTNMFGPVPPNLVDSKGYSWVYERPNQTAALANNPETSTIVPKEVEAVQSQAPGGRWNYRYGLKGLLNEHFVTPGTSPAPQVTSNPPRGGGPLRHRLSRRGRRKKKR